MSSQAAQITPKILCLRSDHGGQRDSGVPHRGLARPAFWVTELPPRSRGIAAQQVEVFFHAGILLAWQKKRRSSPKAR